MPQLFRPAANPLARWSLIGAVLVLAALGLFSWALLRSPSVTGAGRPVPQPVAFSHALHAGQLELDCRYCHVGVERAAFAGMPSTQTCMTCHSQVLANAKALELVRSSWRRGVPLQWSRVNALPEYTYFDHARHVAGGVTCATCHGPVETMAVLARPQALEMSWCLSCHRDPARFLGPGAHGRTGLTDCYTCHR